MANKIQIADVSLFNGLRTDTTPQKCPANYSPDCSDMTFTPGGMATRNPFRALTTLPEEIYWRKEFSCKDGSTQILALGISGTLYVVHADGTHAILDAVTPGSSVSSVTAYGREYMAFFDRDTNQGVDAPRQWDGKQLFRVSQGGPGASPIFSANALSGTSYAIATITQPAPGFPGQLGNFDGIEQSAGPGSNTPGNVITVYTANARAGHFPGGDPVLTAAFNSGNPVYVYLSNLPAEFAAFNGTQLVTSIGLGIPNFAGASAERWYFTFNVDSTASQNAGGINAGITGQYQITAATMTMSVPVPGLTIGGLAAISGASVAGYDNTWTITQTLDSGTISITHTSLTGGTATYSYTVNSGVAPAVGQQIAITGTLNANGVLNGPALTIATATGGSSGSFTVTGFDPSATFPSTVEGGTGITAGTVFVFDPGAPLVGLPTSPIYGSSTGGEITFSATGGTIAPGTRLATAFFITETDLTTFCGPIVKFTIPQNTESIAFANLITGPPNVKARGVAFTGANGGKFFFLPIEPQVNGVVLGTSTVVNDNVTTSGSFSFTDNALFGGIAIDVPGNNLFEQVALNLPRGVDWYADRMSWIGEANVVEDFLNMGMDGGILPGTRLPAGWSSSGFAFGGITQQGIMPVLSGSGTVTQPAYQTGQGAQILQPLLNYSLRVWMWVPPPGGGGFGVTSGTGSIVATISSASTAFSSNLTLSTTGFGYQTAEFSLPMPATIPEDMVFSVSQTNVRIRDLQMIYADNPNRNPLARLSYVQNPEAYDFETGNLGPNDDPTELRAQFKLNSSFHFLTADRLYGVEQIGNTEPSSWVPYQISDKCGAFNANSATTGKGWAAWGGPEGAFLYTGRIPDKTTAIIAPTWRSVVSITSVFNDSDAERVYFGIVRAFNVKSVLVYDYHEIDLGGVGKWCPWNRPVNWVGDSSTGTNFVIGPKFYKLDLNPGTTDDDTGPISGYYTFSPFGVSIFQKAFQYMGFRIAGTGILTPFVYLKTLQTLTSTLRGQDLATLIDTVAEWDNEQRGRLMYLKLGQPGVQYSLEDVTVTYQNDPNAPISGVR